jgi:glycosyltransferase involved in cell wall biosynthesis/peptidoglycan/xylan/chitin deacetylase (PgdA/CDA1 family)
VQQSNLQNTPKVSVIICCYNHAHFLPQAINTILYQCYPNIEIVVVNDGSTDNTERVVQQFNNIVYIHKPNGGLAAARNTGIEKSTGQFILFLDADDFLLPHAISINANYLLQYPHIAFISGGHVSMDGYGNITSLQTNVVESNHFEALLQYNYIGMHATVLYQRWALEYYLFDEALTRGCDDYDSYLGIAAKYPVMHHTQLLTGYRRHDNNVSSNYAEMLTTITNILQKHAQQLTDSTLIAKATIGFDNWKNYYINKEWNKFQQLSVTQWKQKINSGLFLYKTKPVLLNSYYLGNYRKRKIKEFVKKYIVTKVSKPNTVQPSIKKTSSNTCSILMYHRIANASVDCWNLCVSPQNFEQHLQLLQKDNLAIQKVVLTFDDGYEDNFTIAKPLLEKYNIPAIFFVTTHALHYNHVAYYWDVIEKIFLSANNLPANILLLLHNGSIELEIDKAEQPTPCEQTKHWKAISQPPFNSRTNACLKLWVYLQNLPNNNIQHLINQLLQQCNTSLQQLQVPAIASIEMIQSLKNQSLITIGVHTYSHPILPAHNYQQQLAEIKTAKEQLEQILQQPITSFAYPNGKFNANTIACLQALNFETAFTTKAQTIAVEKNDTLQLGRFQVLNITAQQLSQQLAIA